MEQITIMDILLNFLLLFKEKWTLGKVKRSRKYQFEILLRGLSAEIWDHDASVPKLNDLKIFGDIKLFHDTVQSLAFMVRVMEKEAKWMGSIRINFLEVFSKIPRCRIIPT